MREEGDNSVIENPFVYNQRVSEHAQYLDLLFRNQYLLNH